MEKHTWRYVAHAEQPWFRCECTCGHKGMWLRDVKNIKPCKHGHPISPDMHQFLIDMDKRHD